MSSPFRDLGVPVEVADRLAHRGIEVPYPIQSSALPDALAGRDVCGRAPTGSGKTLAFGIPLVTMVGPARPRRPRGLVLVPTRELAAQVAKELALLAGPRDRSVIALYGGVGYGGQVDALRRGTRIVVACPGRLADLIDRREVYLDDVEIAVIDEADRMADMGFLPEVRRILDRVPADRQTMLFSATLDGDVDVLIRRYQRRPARHDIVAADDAPRNRHLFWRAEHAERTRLTTHLVGARWPAIVFCRTKRGADRLARNLGKAGVNAAALHGNRSQGQRERALASFAVGRVQVLVATDIAARGIHVDDVSCVVHYDPPADAKAYVHRSGRTGRAGASGVVVSLIGAEQAGQARKLQAKLGLPAGVHPPDMGWLKDDRDIDRSARRAAAPRHGGESPGPVTGKGRGARRRKARPAA